MNILVVGLSHKTAPVEIREKLSMPETRIEGAMQQLRSLPHIEEAAVLSTCNRLEIYVVARETEQGIRELVQFLGDYGHQPVTELRPHLFILLHEDAVMHLMRVASGLDSLVLGEGQILAQVKHAHKLAQQYEAVGNVLNRLFKQAISAGKRIRTETSIGTGAVSISSAAVELAQMKVANLANSPVAIVGAGKMARLLVQHLLAKGAGLITIVNRSVDKAQDLAAQFPDGRFQVVGIDQMLEAIAQVEMVFTCTASTEPLIAKANLGATLPADKNLMLFDISVPRNVAADVNELPMVKAFNVDDLKSVVAQNQEARRRMAQEAEVLLDEEVEDFEMWWRSLETISTISSLRNKVETIRSQELEKALSRLGTEFAEKHQDIIEALTKGIVNKILHDPMVQLRSQQDIEARRRAMQTLRMLFNLEETEEQYS